MMMQNESTGPLARQPTPPPNEAASEPEELHATQTGPPTTRVVAHGNLSWACGLPGASQDNLSDAMNLSSLDTNRLPASPFDSAVSNQDGRTIDLESIVLLQHKHADYLRRTIV